MLFRSLIVPTTDALGLSKLTYLDRGQSTSKEYLRLFPNLNVSYLLRENLTARFAYYQSVGRPDFNQYAGGLTLPDTSVPVTSSTVISVNNAGIKAWSAESYKVRLEYYFERVGTLNVGAFRRDFKNFFGGITFPATPEFLGYYDLDPDEYGAYNVSTNHNLSSMVRMTGLEFDYKQALTFLPHWARGVQVFANANVLRTQGDAASNFDGFTPQTYNWGVSLSREKYTLRGNWNYRGRQRGALVTGLTDRAPVADLKSLAAEIDAGKVKSVLIVREDAAMLGLPAATLAKARTVVLATHHNVTTAAAEVVLPALTVFERSGTLINCQFRLQAFAQAIPGPAGTLPDALLLARLAGADAKDTWTELATNVPALAGLDGAKLPAEGVALDGAAWSHHKFPEGKLLKFAPIATA